MIKAFKRLFGDNSAFVNSNSGTAAVLEHLENRQMLSISPATAIQKSIKVKNLFSGGVSLNQSLVTVPFTLGIRIKDANLIGVRGYAINPVTGKQKKLVIKILDMHVDPTHTDNLVIHTDRLMRAKGGKIIILEGALTDTKKRVLAEQHLSSPQGQNKERFTLASRAFLPTNHNLFSNDIYGDASAATPAGSHVASGTVATNFKAFMDAKVAKGFITQAQEDSAISRFNGTKEKQIIPDANLRAGMFSLVGTIGEPAIAAMIDGQNLSGKNQTIVDFSSDVSPSAEVAETLVLDSGRLRTLFKTSYAGEPFQALGAKLAHEGVHQDKNDGIVEEVAANSIETYVYAQQLLVSTSFVNANTALIKSDNDKLLAMLDSGRALFPRVGELQGPLHNATNGVFAGAKAQSGGAYLSFENYIRRLYQARSFGNFDSAGNNTLKAMFTNITKLSKTVSFNDSLISDMDANQIAIGDKNAVKLAGILKCSIA